MIRRRLVLAGAVALGLLGTSFVPAWSGPSDVGRVGEPGRGSLRSESALPDGFTPAVARERHHTQRYFVRMEGSSLADKVKAARANGRKVSGAKQSAFVGRAKVSQRAAIQHAKRLGAKIVYRFTRVVNGFSAEMTAKTARAVGRRADVNSVEETNIVFRANASSVPFIGAPEVWAQFGVSGQGMRVAVVDTGIDYTHADFGGPGTVAAYESNDQTVIEPGTFPTAKVIGGFDMVGENYDVLDGDPSNDTPNPDPDPLDSDGHGTHTAGTCCGNGVPGNVGQGVAPDSLLYAVKVWEVGNSTDDVLVAGYEFAVDPNGDGNTSDKVDVLSFSGGVTYGTKSSVEAHAAQAVVDLGTVFVASAGNSGNQGSGGSGYTVGTPATAKGVIAVAASIDEFVAQTLTVNTPSGVEFPNNGIIVHQDWSGDITGDITDDVFDAREVDPPSSPDGQPSPTDRQLCDTTPPGQPFAGMIALVYKGSTGAGDCDGSEKVFRAQEAGAIAVILWSGFGGAPFVLGPGLFADQITIPAVMLGTDDAEVLGDAVSPDAPDSYNTGNVNVTINAETQVIPGFEDRMTDFSSEGPSRNIHILKPDISAPGADIASAAVGTGDEASILSGTSMAAPHVSGVATLLRQLHPAWSPARIKAALMNNATQEMFNNDGTGPVSATIIGTGRVQALESAEAVTLASPPSLSYRLQALADTQSFVQQFTVKNLDDAAHQYTVGGNVRYADFDPALATVQVATRTSGFQDEVSFSLAPGQGKPIQVQLTLDPNVISEAEQLFGWYYFAGNIDGNVDIEQTGNGPADTLHVVWHTVPLAASRDDVSTNHLDLVGDGEETFHITSQSAGIRYADLYLLGAEDERQHRGEEDIAAVGARSFTGSSIDGEPEGVPPGNDALVGLDWQSFLTNADFPDEPVEFVVKSFREHATTESLEVDVLVDAGADGVFADPGLRADYMVVKLPGAGGNVCVFDLSAPSPFDECIGLYFADYSNYNSSLVGLVVDAGDLGLTNAEPELSYRVIQCTGRFSGDVPEQVCDRAGSFDEGTGTWSMRLNATNPSLNIDPLVCGGFWDGGACTEADPIHVTQGSAQAAEDPSILVVFPNNDPNSGATIVTTATGGDGS